MSIVAYVSGHGLGHAAREIEILRRLPPEIPLVVKTLSPSWFWQEEMTRPYELVPEGFDVGSVQHSSINVDVPETLAAWRDVDSRNRAGFEQEKDDLRRRGAKAIVGDITPWAFVLADAMGLPAFCPTNFTWADIYGEYISEEAAFAPIVRELERQYNLAVLLNTDLDLPMPYFTQREDVGLVARTGQNRRAELLPHLPADSAQKHIALVYAGNWGLPLAWEKLASFTDWHFITLTPPKESYANLSALPRTILPHQDIVASVDLVISKPGYGLVGECLAAGTPLFYCPRTGFAEYAAMDREMIAWGGGYKRSMEDFIALNWESVLESVLSAEPLIPRPAEGGANAARRIAEAWHAVSSV